MLLAVDTSTPQIGLALYDGAQVLAESLWTSKARHTVELAPALADMLAHTGLKINEIAALGVAIGPGSFTSLRVGLSFVKGLAFARSLPTFGINTLDIVAASQTPDQLPLLCTLPAGRGRLAVGSYILHTNKSEFSPEAKTRTTGYGLKWQIDGAAVIMTAGELATSVIEDTFVCGDLNAAERKLLVKNEHVKLISPALSMRRPAILAELAYTRWQTDAADDISNLAPLYLHLTDPIPDPTAAVITT
ncbi:MAG: tRNA (adenosine(37)-N6)-threonylcarbamoyltransferase complex dimerization subunit type 1 TsaB [Chloroflexota bacterium]